VGCKLRINSPRRPRLEISTRNLTIHLVALKTWRRAPMDHLMEQEGYPRIEWVPSRTASTTPCCVKIHGRTSVPHPPLALIPGQ
jgi:hypothetical protein